LSSLSAQVVDAVCEKELVLLGELPSHGEAKAFGAKARIVDGLVRRCGFSALLFEAPLYDFLDLEGAMRGDRAEPARLDRAIGGFWLTRGLRDWRRWLFASASEGQLHLGGLDDQVSATSDFARAALPELAADVLREGRSDACPVAIDRNLNWRYGSEQRYDEAERALLQQCAQRAVQAIVDTGGSDDAERRVMLQNLASLYDRQQGGDSSRDEVMYRNLRWHHSRLPPGTKIIVWTATVHAAREQGGRDYRPLGAWAAEHWGDRLASVGFTAFRGESSRAGAAIESLPPAPPGSLEALVTRAGARGVWVGRSDLREYGVRPSRLLGGVVTADWSRHFDGVVVFREEHAPRFERR